MLYNYVRCDDLCVVIRLMFFRQPQNKTRFFKTIVCIVRIPLLSFLISHPKTFGPIDDESISTGVRSTYDSAGGRAVDSKHGESFQEKFDCKEV